MLQNRIKEVRKALKIDTQEELAEKLNIKLTRVQDIERGKVKELKASELIAFQENLLVNTWYLLTGKDNILIEKKELNYKEETIKTLEKLNENDLKSVYHFAKSREN